jgi:hypothetical protein
MTHPSTLSEIPQAGSGHVNGSSRSLLPKTRWMKWSEHAVRVRKAINIYRILVGKPEWKWPLERYDINARTALKFVLKKHGVRMSTGFVSTRDGLRC